MRLHMRPAVRSAKALSLLSQKSATVAENGETTAKFGDCRTFLRQCGQALKFAVIFTLVYNSREMSAVLACGVVTITCHNGGWSRAVGC